MFVVRHPERDALIKRLNDAGVGAMIHYPIPPHRQAAYAGMNLGDGALPLAERLASEVLSLPIGPQMELATVDVINQICFDST